MSLNETSIEFSGGIFRFLSFSQHNWPWILVRESVQLPEVQCLIVLLGISLITIVALVLRCFLITFRDQRQLSYQVFRHPADRAVERSNNLTTLELHTVIGDLKAQPEQRQAPEHLSATTNEDETSPISMNTIQSANSLQSSGLQSNRSRSLYNVLLSSLIVLQHAIPGLPYNRLTERTAPTSQLSTSSKSRKNCVLVLKQSIQSLRCSYLKRDKCLVACSVLLFMLVIIGLIYTGCYAVYLKKTLDKLPNQVTNVTSLTETFLLSAIDTAYSEALQQLKLDVALPGNDSHIRRFSRHILTEAATEFAKISTKQPFLVDTKVTADIASTGTRFVNNLLMLTQRFSRLMEASQLVQVSRQQQLQREYFDLSRKLAVLAPRSLLLADSNAMHTFKWENSRYLSITYHLLCKNNASFPLMTNCSQLTEALSGIVNDTENTTTPLKKEDVTELLQFMLIPRVMNSEEIIIQWMPVIGDPLGSAPLFVERFLPPEVEKGRQAIRQLFETVSEVIASSKIVNYVSQIMLVTFVILGVLVGVAMVCSLLPLYMQVCCKKQTDYRDEPPASCCTGRDHRGVLCFAVVCGICGVLFSLAGTVIVYMTVLAENEFCVYIFQGPQQPAADAQIKQELGLILRDRVLPVDVATIRDIHLAFPHPLLNTLDSKYSDGDPALLSALHINKPANVSAILYSDWLDIQLRYLWGTEVLPRIAEENIPSKLPRISLTKVFQQIRKQLMLDANFDELQVNTAQQYLNLPLRNYYTPIGLQLSRLSNGLSNDVEMKAADILAKLFVGIGLAIDQYSQHFNEFDDALTIIHQNRHIMKPLSQVIDFLGRVLDSAQSMTEEEISTTVTQMVNSLWVTSKEDIRSQVLPVIEDILDRLVPYPHLHALYRTIMEPICAPSTELITSALVPIVHRLALGFTLTSSTLAIFIAISLPFYYNSR